MVGSIGTDGVNGSKLELMITMKGYGEVNERVDVSTPFFRETMEQQESE